MIPDEQPLTARLEGSLLVLEPFAPEHAEGLWEAAQPEEIWAWLTNIGLHRAHRQTVPVSGHGTDDPGRDFQQHAVEVITHVLLGHGEAGAFDQATQFALLQAAGQRARAFFHCREIVGG